jgi:hypothetical protein
MPSQRIVMANGAMGAMLQGRDLSLEDGPLPGLTALIAKSISRVGGRTVKAAALCLSLPAATVRESFSD